jgi:hypothetical protein
VLETICLPIISLGGARRRFRRGYSRVDSLGTARSGRYFTFESPRAVPFAGRVLCRSPSYHRAEPMHYRLSWFRSNPPRGRAIIENHNCSTPDDSDCVARATSLSPNDGLGLSGSPLDLAGAMALGRQQNDLRPPDILLRAVPIDYNCLQLGSVGGGQPACEWPGRIGSTRPKEEHPH